MVGGGPARSQVESLIEDLGISDQARVLGVVRHGQLPEIYRSASVFVLPSTNEASSNAMLEAMASGLPAIATETGTAELMDDSGLVIDTPSEEQIFQAAATYLEDSELLRRHGINARRIAEALSWDRVAAEYLDIYRQVTSGTTS